MDRTELLRRIPQVDAVLRDAAMNPALDAFGATVVTRIVRDEITRVRAAAERGVEPPETSAVAAAAATQASALHSRRLRRVINATGVILHTNLGRATLSQAAIDAVVGAAGPTPLEYDLEEGTRSSRAPLAGFLAAALTGAEAALIVNNNAAALLLILAALARNKEVIVSRGELIEIGGEFRLPSIMEASGAILREAGTTNRTHARDFRGALCDRTAMILSVHPSNYQVVGFTAAPALEELAAIAREAGIPLVHDIGSGLLLPDAAMPGEPDATTSLTKGAGLVCFSGDKLLGGPQAGIIAGSKALIDACRRHPIARAVRADKLMLAAMEATLLAHARDESTPVNDMMRTNLDVIRERAAAMAARLPHATVTDGESVTGGGSLPGHSIATALLCVPCADPGAAAARLRQSDPPVIARLENDRLILDLRTVDPGDDAHVLAAIAAAIR